VTDQFIEVGGAKVPQVEPATVSVSVGGEIDDPEGGLCVWYAEWAVDVV
jgi:hypothetical protein